MNAARSVYEMHIDIRILCINQDDTSLVEKFHAHSSVARYQTAKKYVEAADRYPKEAHYGDVETRRLIVVDERIRSDVEAAMNKSVRKI